MSELGEALLEAIKNQNRARFDQMLATLALEVLNEIDDKGNTALHYAVQGYAYDPQDPEHEEDHFVRQLLKKRVNLNIKDAQGSTAFFLALQKPRNKQLVELFLGKRYLQVNNSGLVAVASYYSDLTHLKKSLRYAGALEYRVEAHQSIHHHL